ncbi:MAG TPA: LytR C-terminal domain-containing protein [Gemmatimonadales bacterium]
MALLEQSRRWRVTPLLVVVALAASCKEREPPPALAAEDGSRVVVEVLNASSRRGLARIGTRVLREAGLDVVSFGNAESALDSTRILIRRGSDHAGRRVARVLGVGVIERRLDSLLLVDVTVLLGRDWRPPPDPRP